MAKAPRKIYKRVEEIDLNAIDDNHIITGSISIDDIKVSNHTEIISRAEIVNIPFDEGSTQLNEAAAALGIKNKQEDLLYIHFKLVHANTNKNKDKFTEFELRKAEKTPILKLLNWGHGEPNIGVIYQSKLVEGTEDEPAYLDCLAAVSKYKYPKYAQEIIDRHENGDLFFSMEVWFKEAQCSICEEVFSTGEEGYCSHLKDRYSEGSMADRLLRELTFAGAGCVESPADIQAESLAIASERVKKENVQITQAKEEIVVDMFTQEQVDQMIEKAIAKYVSDLGFDPIELKTKLAEMETTVADAQAGLTSLSTEKTELQTRLETLTKEFEDTRHGIETERAARIRMLELASIGFAVPDALANEKEYNELFEKVRVMDSNSFDILKQIVVSNPKVNANTIVEASVITEEEDGEPEIPITTVNDNIEDSPIVKAQKAMANILNTRSS